LFQTRSLAFSYHCCLFNF